MNRAVLIAFALAAAAFGQSGRVVVVGVDGMDLKLTRRFLAEGVLPELKALAGEGGFIPLRPTNPAQSPVSWATFMTGRNPGATGTFDFLKRTTTGGEIGAELALVEKDVRSVRLPALAALAASTALAAWISRRLRKRGALFGGRAFAAVAAFSCAAIGAAWALLPSTVTLPKNPRGGTTFFETADRAGVTSASVFAPLAFPAPELRHGHLLCGLGVPDVAGTPGLATLWREGPVPGGGRVTATGCRELPLRTGGDRLFGVGADGPKDAKGKRARSAVSVLALRARRGVTVKTDGGEATFGERAWSPFLPVSFDVMPFVKVHGLARFRLMSGGERTTLYQEPTCFDPARPSRFAPISTPPEFGSRLAEGRPFDTLGWACATNPLQDGLIDEEAFLSDVMDLDRDRFDMTLRAVDDPSRRLVFSVLATVDRVQHVFWRDYDPEHPMHDPSLLARRGDPIREAYRRLDDFIGRVRKRLKPEDLLLVASDHGFASFRTAVNLNRWLAEEGLMVGVGSSDDDRTIEGDLEGAPLFRGVDWSATRAYSVGLGKIWINLAGREPSGSVPPADRLAVMEDVRRRLLLLRDGEKPVVRSVKFRDEIYSGPRVEESADLIVGFEDGYRVSWQSTLGSLSEPVLAPNRALWSGDHCSVDPEIVPGVLFATLPTDAAGADVADIYPTILRALGLPTPGDLDGEAIPWRTP